MVIFYESDNSMPESRIESLLVVDGMTVWQQVVPVSVKRGVNLYDVAISAPPVTKTVKAELIVRLKCSRSGFNPIRMQHEETVYLMPRTSLATLPADTIALLDNTGQSAKALASVHLQLSPLKTLTPEALAGKKLLIVAGDYSYNNDVETIQGFVRNGGNVIFLQRTQPDLFGQGYPEIDTRHAASRVWKRTFDSPILDGIENGQLSYWRPDNLVSKRSFVKPFDGDNSVLLDSGGQRGMEWTPLCETSLGKGAMLFSQLSLLDRLDVEPASGAILAKMITYGLQATVKETRTLRVLSQGNEKLETLLTTCRIVYTRGLAGDGPVLWDASYKLSGAEEAQLVAYLNGGGTVWLHGFTPDTSAATEKLLSFTPELKPIDPTIQTAVRTVDSPLVNNISSGDLKWAVISLWDRGGYFGGAKPTAKLGDFYLNLPNLNAGKHLVEPGLLTAIPVGKGTVLFDTFNWEGAFATEAERVTRVVSALAINVGAGIKKLETMPYDYFPISLAQSANMGYVDEVAEDGQGGWFDMGREDLCYFLTNHTEQLGVDGAALAAEPFPEHTRFMGVPFTLVDPKKNNNKTLVVLGSKTHGMKLPAEIKGIPVNHTADALWFIQAASYVPKQKGVTIARYVIHFADGGTVNIPVRSGIEVNDWSDPLKPEKAVICWTGNNRVAANKGLYLAKWENPTPAKTITSIDVIGNLTDAQLAVVGIAGGVKK